LFIHKTARRDEWHITMTTSSTTKIHVLPFVGAGFSLQVDLDAPFKTLLLAAAKEFGEEPSDVRLICNGRDLPSIGCSEADSFTIRHPSFSDRSMTVTKDTIFHAVFCRRNNAPPVFPGS
jgi:hypothetical protein